MKKVFLLSIVVSAVGMFVGCKALLNSKDDVFVNIRDYKDLEFNPFSYIDTITSYSTLSADNNIVVIPEEITKEQYERLFTDKYTIQPETITIDSNSALYVELCNKGLQNSLRYYITRDFDSTRVEDLYYGTPIYYYPETKQYEYIMFAPLTEESFMMSEDGVVDSTFMMSQTRTYGTNRIFVGQEGHDCDYHGSLWFYKYDEQRHRMITLCHYIDCRWSEDCFNFNLCWISDDELLVSAISAGNEGWKLKPYEVNLASWGTPVYYKLKITRLS